MEAAQASKGLPETGSPQARPRFDFWTTLLGHCGRFLGAPASR